MVGQDTGHYNPMQPSHALCCFPDDIIFLLAQLKTSQPANMGCLSVAAKEAVTKGIFTNTWNQRRVSTFGVSV